MNKLAMGLGLLALAALLAAGLALRKAAECREEIRVLRAAAPVFVPAPAAPVEQPPPVPDVAPVPVAVSAAGGEVQRVEVAPAAPAAPAPPPLPEHAARDLENFDRAMDREFDRLDGRAAAPANAAEQDVVTRLKEQLLKLDEIRARAESAAPEENESLRAEMQQVMGSIISLGAAHRRNRIEDLARQAGYDSEQEIAAFLDEVDRIYRETELDWASLFNRGP
ncbi:MAG TPA: hypothetical protein P5567_14370 [Kiritimatiellia bacterium]|nr:hypothetical protein [Kiritimatiellia bacterium]HRZ13626.1 hypothetical protein [Kiritimatiellia bacterium]HSA19278.1 hypothetical protein [Kiritimatiellia bacterium]